MTAAGALRHAHRPLSTPHDGASPHVVSSLTTGTRRRCPYRRCLPGPARAAAVEARAAPTGHRGAVVAADTAGESVGGNRGRTARGARAAGRDVGRDGRSVGARASSTGRTEVAGVVELARTAITPVERGRCRGYATATATATSTGSTIRSTTGRTRSATTTRGTGAAVERSWCWRCPPFRRHRW